MVLFKMIMINRSNKNKQLTFATRKNSKHLRRNLSFIIISHTLHFNFNYIKLRPSNSLKRFCLVHLSTKTLILPINAKKA